MCWCIRLLVVWFFAWLVCSISYWLGFPTPGTVAGIALGATGLIIIIIIIIIILITLAPEYPVAPRAIPATVPGVGNTSQ